MNVSFMAAPRSPAPSLRRGGTGAGGVRVPSCHKISDPAMAEKRRHPSDPMTGRRFCAGRSSAAATSRSSSRCGAARNPAASSIARVSPAFSRRALWTWTSCADSSDAERRHVDDQPAAWAQHAVDFGERRRWLDGGVAQHVGGDHGAERVRGEGSALMLPRAIGRPDLAAAMAAAGSCHSRPKAAQAGCDA